MISARMTNAAVYFRAHDDLREALEAFRLERGVTLSAAVVELLALGLEAHSDGPSVSDLQRQVLQLQAELAKRDADVATARGELQHLRLGYHALEEHLKRADVGTCPTCRAPTSGYEFVVTRRCSACNGALSGAPPARDSAALWLIAGIAVALLAYAAVQQ